MIKLYQHRGTREDALKTETVHEDVWSLFSKVEEVLKRNHIKATHLQLNPLDYEDPDYNREVLFLDRKGNTGVFGFAKVCDEK